MPALAPLINYKKECLDHGYIRVVDYMGSDETIEAAARLSTNTEGRTTQATTKLLNYLMKHRHTSPFEQANISLEMHMPIFVARQLVRHRTQSINEVSARYTELPNVYYTPNWFLKQSLANKQGSVEGISEQGNTYFMAQYDNHHQNAFALYRAMLEAGISREQARMVLPLSTYTLWQTTMNAHNFMHMIKLRIDPHAQSETREYAKIMLDILRKWLPITAEAFEEYVLESHTFTSGDLAVISTLLEDTSSAEFITRANEFELSSREITALMTAIFGNECKARP